MRLIDADALVEQMESHIYWGDSVIGLLVVAKNAPTIDAEPVRHGVWGETQIIGYDGIHPVYAKPCSECGHLTDMYRPRFCPNCGAKMDAEPKPTEPRKICPSTGLECIECVPGYGCAKTEGGTEDENA